MNTTNLTYCNGYSKNPLEYYNKTGMTISNSIFEQIKHKKLNVFYCISCRYKISPGYETNTEHITINIDHNLSTDFSLDYIDFSNQKSFKIYIETIKQPRYGETICEYVIEYINENQELFQHKSTFRVPTIKGTVEKKLFEIKKYFDEYAQKELENFKNNGFYLPNLVLCYIIIKYAEKHLKSLNINRIYDYSYYIKPLLIFYSMLADDCFLTLYHNPKRISYYSFPLDLNSFRTYEDYNDNTFLLSEQIELIEKLVDFINNNRNKIQEIQKISDTENTKWGHSEYFDYFILKDEFLKIFN